MYWGNSSIWTAYPQVIIDGNSDPATILLGHPEFRRLENIRQTSFAYVANPAANNTRLEHSIGTGYMARGIGKILGFSRDDITHLGISGACHDLGHPFWSHIGELFLREFTGKEHEYLTLEKLEQLQEMINSLGFDYKKIRAIVDGTHAYHPIVSGPVISADKLDYLSRDRYHIGHPQFDVPGLLPFLHFDGETYGVREEGLGALEAVVRAYAFNYLQEYQSETAMLIGAAMQKALFAWFRRSRIDPSQMWNWDDIDAMSLIRSSRNPVTSGVYQSIFGDTTRNELVVVKKIKRGYAIPSPNSVDDEEYRQLAGSISTIARRYQKEAQIAESLGMRYGDIVIFSTSGDRARNLDDVTVFSSHNRRGFFEASPHIKLYLESQASFHDSICLAVNVNSMQRALKLTRGRFVKLLHELE